MDTALIWPFLGQAWLLVAMMMTALWAVQAKTKNASFVDIGWTVGIWICAVVYVFSANPNQRTGWLLAMVTAWAVRLSWLLIRRLIRHPVEDSRYRKIRDSWPTHTNLKMFGMFQFQGLLDVVLSWPFLVICLNPADRLSLLEVFGIMIFFIGLVGESLADHQATEFKKTQGSGKVCDQGLWYYSRHPNYFFEWTIWMGYFVFALASPWGVTAFIAPAIMLYLLLKVSGVPLAEEQSLRTKKEAYRQYQQTTSVFIPLPKRKI